MDRVNISQVTLHVYQTYFLHLLHTLSIYIATLLEILDVIGELSITPIGSMWRIKCDKVMHYSRIRGYITGEMPFADI